MSKKIPKKSEISDFGGEGVRRLKISDFFLKNVKLSKLPKTQNKPIKVFFKFSRGRSELRKFQTRKNSSKIF